MRFLLLNSLVIVGLLASCKSEYKDLQPADADVSCILKFRPAFQVNWYNASVDVVGKHISGLLLFKTMPDSTIRIVFTNEVGITFFDFGFLKSGDFRVFQVIKQLDRKVVITLLRKDFELMMMSNLRKGDLKSLTRNGENFIARTGKNETDYFITAKIALLCYGLKRHQKGS